MKRAMLLLLTVLSVLAFTLPTTLADTSEWDYYHDLWEATSTTLQGYTNNGASYEVYHVGSPSERAGETYHFTETVSYAGSLGGEINVSLSTINSMLSFSYQEVRSFALSKVSAPLQLGEYLVVSVRNYYEKHRINQALIRSGYMVDYDDNMNQIGYRYVSEQIDSAVAYAYKPLMPQIRMQYFMDDGTNSRSGDTLIRTEYYTYVNGSWQKH